MHCTGQTSQRLGWLVAVMRYLEKLGVRQMLAHALPDGRTSPNQIPVLDLVLALFAAVLTGGRRFAHVERLRTDEVVQAILGVKRMPSAMTLTRYFGGLVHSQIEHLSEVLGQFGLRRVARAGAIRAHLRPGARALPQLIEAVPTLRDYSFETLLVNECPSASTSKVSDKRIGSGRLATISRSNSRRMRGWPRRSSAPINGKSKA